LWKFIRTILKLALGCPYRGSELFIISLKIINGTVYCKTPRHIFTHYM